MERFKIAKYEMGLFDIRGLDVFFNIKDGRIESLFYLYIVYCIKRFYVPMDKWFK